MMRRRIVLSLIISIHAPERGATTHSGIFLETIYNFNPRPRAGSDWKTVLRRFIYMYFNPRPRAGSDWILPALAPSQHGISIHAPERGAT